MAHVAYHERSSNVILKGHDIRRFLDSGQAEIYEVKEEPGHMVRHLSTAALNLATLRAHSQQCSPYRTFAHKPSGVIYRNVYSTTYVGHMQTNNLTTLWQPQVPSSCVCNSNAYYFTNNCKQKNDSQKISAGGSVPSRPTKMQLLSLERPATGMPGRTQQAQLKPCAKTSDWPPPRIMPHRPRGRLRWN